MRPVPVQPRPLALPCLAAFKKNPFKENAVCCRVHAAEKYSAAMTYIILLNFYKIIFLFL